MALAQTLIDESESAELAGVSVQTIQQYVEIGLLSPIGTGDDKKYRQVDIEEVFRVSREQVLKRAADKQQADAAEELLDAAEAIEPEIEHAQFAHSTNTSLDMLQTTSTLREQIQMLKDERDWLRERVEKLEQRSEREQMLLLSESETVRRLIGKEEKKRGFWSSLALPWFGDMGKPGSSE